MKSISHRPTLLEQLIALSKAYKEYTEKNKKSLVSNTFKRKKNILSILNKSSKPLLVEEVLEELDEDIGIAMCYLALRELAASGKIKKITGYYKRKTAYAKLE